MIPALAASPSRASNSFTIAWGLVTIPVSVFTGTEETRVKRSEFLDGTEIPVGRSPIRKDTGEVIDSALVVRRSQATNGTWVELTDEEIAICTSPKGLGEVVSFVPTKDVGQYVVENLVQVRPKATKGKVDPAAAKAYALLLTAMRNRKVVALVKVALRGPARYGLLDATGNFALVRTADAVREALPVALDYKFSEAELNLATTLIEAVGVDTPIITDDTAPAVQAYVDAKAGGAPAPAPLPSPTTEVDIMATLEASIAARKGKAAA
jgi:DNA end-binding protein Ku